MTYLSKMTDLPVPVLPRRLISSVTRDAQKYSNQAGEIVLLNLSSLCRDIAIVKLSEKEIL